ncbi:hypothetical protein [Achromobacter deleyi]|uniref:hypothetical protein n=1 Tax=Achromobacter deleyi TaxID=1353891 RepID=UPI001491F455|nr:hypothetical protein [Achromobacter deleyi]QVQ27831.1 hypothetical protein HLG70_05130 [Achromobacter deleyi]UIP23437.1 hypothetical protein LYZ39_13245 [Achromobacter deleyi]
MNQDLAKRRYFKELGIALALYAVLLVGALRLGQNLPPGALRTVVLLSPMLAFLLALRAVVRAIRHSDEFIRKTTLEHLAIAAAVTAGVTFTYGFLEIAGFPKLSMFVVWPLMGAVWACTTIVDHLRHR